MKATGIVRRIDDLGRVVIPKEIRRTLRIREGDPLEIFTEREGSVILRKYSPIGEIGAVAGLYAESLAHTMNCIVSVSYTHLIVAVHKENGMPMLKQKNGDAYQPIFTDILEFRKFNKEDQFKTMAIEAKNVPKMLVNEAKGVVINPYGVNLQIPIVRPEEPQEKK